MNRFILTPPPTRGIAVAGTGALFPVRRIYCVGRNYAAHAREMGKDPDREPPFFFSKPADAVVGDGETVAYPPQTANLHFEGELVVAIGRGGSDIARQVALDHVFGYAAGNDLTRRDLQNEAKEMGRPWDLAKGFDCSAAVGPILRAAGAGHFQSGAITTNVNGVERQRADLGDMIWPTADVIAFLSRFVRLEAGDLIMTGTPAGVGALHPGDVCVVTIEGVGSVTTRIGAVAAS